MGVAIVIALVIAVIASSAKPRTWHHPNPIYARDFAGGGPK